MYWTYYVRYLGSVENTCRKVHFLKVFFPVSLFCFSSFFFSYCSFILLSYFSSHPTYMVGNLFPKLPCSLPCSLPDQCNSFRGLRCLLFNFFDNHSRVAVVLGLVAPKFNALPWFPKAECCHQLSTDADRGWSAVSLLPLLPGILPGILPEILYPLAVAFYFTYLCTRM